MVNCLDSSDNFVTVFYHIAHNKILRILQFNPFMRGKKDFVEISQNLAKYQSENNFVGPSK